MVDTDKLPAFLNNTLELTQMTNPDRKLFQSKHYQPIDEYRERDIEQCLRFTPKASSLNRMDSCHRLPRQKSVSVISFHDQALTSEKKIHPLQSNSKKKTFLESYIENKRKQEERPTVNKPAFTTF